MLRRRVRARAAHERLGLRGGRESLRSRGDDPEEEAGRASLSLRVVSFSSHPFSCIRERERRLGSRDVERGPCGGLRERDRHARRFDRLPPRRQATIWQRHRQSSGRATNVCAYVRVARKSKVSTLVSTKSRLSLGRGEPPPPTARASPSTPRGYRAVPRAAQALPSPSCTCAAPSDTSSPPRCARNNTATLSPVETKQTPANLAPACHRGRPRCPPPSAAQRSSSAHTHP